jgi:sialic acid synthase SpsE
VYDRNTESKGATFKRSILVSSPVKSGDLLTRDNIRVARPSDGLCPSLWFDVLGARAITDMDIGHPLSKKDFNKNI